MALDTGGPSAVPTDRYDADRLLAGYQTARAQEALFDLRHGPGIGYDEFVDNDGNVRPSWAELADTVAERGRAGLNQLRSLVHSLIDNDGITYTEVDPSRDGATGGHGLEPRPWSLDTLPVVISAADWEVLEAGLVQRSRLLDAVLADLYGPRSLITEGVLPPELVFAHPGYVRAANGIEIPGRHQLFMHACDLSRLPDGGFQVNADWTQAPSGAGYALADRRVVAHSIPDLYESIGPRPTTPFAQALRLALIDAAPDVAQDPVVVVLSPGIYSET
ncbi:MAG TPA: circularly permuted type 2 ATP-grasp protein, partial [Mycobacterium sp.]|nr:circularly permuted type 2 ATP-grasp protein [Mycobacterium sp.]